MEVHDLPLQRIQSLTARELARDQELGTIRCLPRVGDRIRLSTGPLLTAKADIDVLLAALVHLGNAGRGSKELRLSIAGEICALDGACIRRSEGSDGVVTRSALRCVTQWSGPATPRGLASEVGDHYTPRCEERALQQHEARQSLWNASVSHRLVARSTLQGDVRGSGCSAESGSTAGAGYHGAAAPANARKA